MGKASVNAKVESESLDRINIHYNMYETIMRASSGFKKNPRLGYAVKGVLFEYLVDSLLNGCREITDEEIKAKLGFTGENEDYEDFLASTIGGTATGFKNDIQATRRSYITGKRSNDKKDKKIEVSQPSESLPEGLEG